MSTIPKTCKQNHLVTTETKAHIECWEAELPPKCMPEQIRKEQIRTEKELNNNWLKQ